MIARETVIDHARAWIGTPFQHQASLRGVAADCIGLVVGVARECGIAEAAAWEADPDCRAYARAPDARMLLAAASRYLDAIAPAAVRLGDILLLRFTVEPQHFALVSALEPRRIIHAYSGSRRVVEHGLTAAWARRVVGAFRYRGVG